MHAGAPGEEQRPGRSEARVKLRRECHSRAQRRAVAAWLRAVIALVLVVAAAAAIEAPGARAQTVDDGPPPIVRVAARGTESGSVEFALQQLTTTAEDPWGELLFGRSRFMTPRLIALQRVARRNFQLLVENPGHPSLRFKKVGAFWSARVGRDYRALAVEDGGDVIWVWIGSHADYDRLIGS